MSCALALVKANFIATVGHDQTKWPGWNGLDRTERQPGPHNMGSSWAPTRELDFIMRNVIFTTRFKIMRQALNLDSRFVLPDF